MRLRKITGIAAVVGLLIVLASMLSRYFDILPNRSRIVVMVIGFTVMFLASIWRVVSDMNQQEDVEKE